MSDRMSELGDRADYEIVDRSDAESEDSQPEEVKDESEAPDQWFDEKTYDPETEVREFEKKKKKKFLLHGTMALVSYLRSNVEDHMVFYEALVKRLHEISSPSNPATGEKLGFQVYGAQERHADGTPHYHVVILWNGIVHYCNAQKLLRVYLGEGSARCADNAAINIRPLRGRQPPADFLDRTQGYAVKDGNQLVFGVRIVYEVGVNRRKQQAFAAAIEELDPEKARAIMIAVDPQGYVGKFLNMEAFLRSKKRPRGPKAWAPKFTPKPWVVPRALQEWRDANFAEDGSLLDPPPEGRYTSVLVLGDSKTGKSNYFLSFGRPDHFRERFHLEKLTRGSTHLIVDDVRLEGVICWRALIGCQDLFSATDKYMRTLEVEFDKPTAWVCNFDMDPRKDPVFAEYARQCGLVVVELAGPLFETEKRKRQRLPLRVQKRSSRQRR